MLWRSSSPARRPAGFVEPCLPTLGVITDGNTIFRHACAMGLEGVVAKRRDKPYRSGRSPDWIKVKNPDAPAATRVIEG